MTVQEKSLVWSTSSEFYSIVIKNSLSVIMVTSATGTTGEEN